MNKTRRFVVLILVFLMISGCDINSGQTASTTDEILSTLLPNVEVSSATVVSPTTKTPVITESPVATETPSITQSPEALDIFTDADKLSVGIDLGDSPDQVKTVLGEPNNITSEYEGYFGADVYYYYYDFGYIIFEPGTNQDDLYVALIKITNSDQATIRNCDVGMDYHTIISNFPNENFGKNKYWEDVLYDIAPNKDKSYGVLGYYADGVPERILYVYDGETQRPGRILQFELHDGAVTEIILYYKYSEAAMWHSTDYLNGTLSTDSNN